jgi:predicted lipopolysaccharide heptosyltransferase III
MGCLFPAHTLANAHEPLNALMRNHPQRVDFTITLRCTMKHTYKNILLIQLGDIGDVVLSIPALRAVHENFPHAKIIIAVREKAQELIQHLPGVDSVISINQDTRSPLNEIKYQWAFFSLVRRYRFDLVFDFRTGTRGAILAFLSGAKERVSFFDHESFWRNRLFTKLYRLDYKLPQHVADYYSSLPMAYGLNVNDEIPVIHVTPAMEQQAARILEGEKVPSELPIIAIQPFSLWRYKEWGVHKYIQLIQRILSEYKVTIVITGSGDEYERAKNIVDHCKDNGRYVFNMAGKTSLGELAAVLKLCRLFIGSDSAGMHIAAAVGTPTVIIFGPSAPASWAPKGNIHAIVQRHLSCVPCRRKGCEDTEVSRCLEELDVSDVFAVVRSHYEKISSSAV